MRVQNQCAYGVCTCTLSACAAELEGGGENSEQGRAGGDVRFSNSGGPLVETLSESKSFLKRQTLLIFLLFSIFFFFFFGSVFYVYIKK